MKILILGGDGFIGSNLRKRHLENDDQVIIIDKDCIRSTNDQKEYQFIQEYIEFDNYQKLQDVLKTVKPDFVYNCIAVANPHFYTIEPLKTFQLDFQVNLNIINILNKFKIPFIHFSTCEVYGKHWSEPYREDLSDCIFGPTNKIRWIYATSKLLLDQILFADQNEHVTIRPFNFIGHDIDWLPDINKSDKFWRPRLPSCFLNNLLTNKPLNVVLPGDQKRCYTYIDDAVDAIMSIIQNWSMCKNEIINIGSPDNEIKVIDAALLMTEAYSYYSNIINKPNITLVDGKDYYGSGYEDCERRIPDISKINNLTGWNPKINLKDTFYRTVNNGILKFKRDQNPHINRMKNLYRLLKD